MRWLLILPLLIVPTACEFEPLYGDRRATPVENQLAGVSVGVIADRTGQVLRNELRTRFDPNNQGAPKRFDLLVTLTETRQDIAIRRDASATRTNLTIRAEYRLVNAKDATIVTSGNVRSLNSYDILSTESEFANRTAEKSARQRAANDLANQISARVVLAIGNINQAPTR